MAQNTDSIDLYTETYRPQFHYTAPCRWLNDPNGLVYYEGEYHLFYQYHPDSLNWGPMHWGHAVSTDLVHWETLPIALYPDDNGTIFSGGVVVDADNTSGLVPGGGLVAIYSYNTQTQGVAYSTDNGRTWTKYDENPVIDALAPDFRDPKVFWHDDTNQWVMAIASGNEVQLFVSSNLIDWEQTSRFTVSGTSGVWEVPDLFPLEMDGETKWVMIVSVGSGAPAGGSGTIYFIGDFDGKRFSQDNPGEILWLDYGSDNYAGTTWNNEPDGRRLFIAWMSNWVYAQQTPTYPWRGAMIYPRELTLVNTEEGIRLKQEPVALDTIRCETLSTLSNVTITHDDLLDLRGRTLEIEATFEIGTGNAFGIDLHHGQTDAVQVFYDVIGKRLFIRRPSSNINGFSTAFSAPLLPTEGQIKLHILLDESSIEVFASDGMTVLTAQTFVSTDHDGIRVFSDGGSTQLIEMTVRELECVWHEDELSMPDFCS